MQHESLNQVSTDLQNIRIDQSKNATDMEHIVEKMQFLERDVRQVQFSQFSQPAPAGSGEPQEGAPVVSGDAEQDISTPSNGPPMHQIMSLVEKLDNLQRDHQRLDSYIKHQAQQQEQKDFAQDELLNMELDAIKREVDSCVRATALEEQRKVMIGKIHHMEQELKEDVTSQSAEVKEKLIADSRNLQHQLKQVSEAISSQIRLLDEKILSNQAKDDEREKELDEKFAALTSSVEQLKLKRGTGKRHTIAGNSVELSTIKRRISQIETNLDLDPSELQELEDLQNNFSLQDLSSAPPEGSDDGEEQEPPEVIVLNKRVTVLEGFLDKKRRTTIAASAGGMSGADQTLVLQQIQGLAKRVGDLEQAKSGQGGTYLTEAPDATEETKQRLGKVETKVTTLETSVDKAKREDRKKMEELQSKLSGVQKAVQDMKPQGEKTFPEDGNPLAWLDTKINELAKREDRREKGELPKRVGLLEVHQRDFDYRLNAVRGDVGDEIEAQLEKVAQRFKEEQKDAQDTSAVVSSGDALRRSLESDKAKAGGVTDDIWEEMQRLRCMIECMETAVPLETRKAMEFFKRSPRSTAPDSSQMVQLESKLSTISAELERKTSEYQAGVSGEIGNVLRIVKGMEKETEILSSKIADICIIHPKVLNALEVVEAILGYQELDQTAGGAELLRQQMHSTVESLKMSGNKTLLNVKDFDTITQEVREDFDQNVGRMRAEFSSALCTKADASDVAELFGMVQAIRSQSTTPGPSRPQTTDQYSRVPSRASSRGSMMPTNPRGNVAATHPRSRASTPLDPNPGQRAWESDSRRAGFTGMGQSQSTGRLPTLSR
eukprot:gnl/MRDRNA2_/MRDRNA2_116258_c0_seq1.p1 gnl/MRDRNA2_/MRDRNA2_116258_c0~~gnl/MRDRNA2_/MRDRNA2_116258_c0_seq1.p1  ORF type:complete len:897 (-),score=230.55 gnl/MRDRNA2_/MRDRNA2_116258_c0_seq1:55-2550(-)